MTAVAKQIVLPPDVYDALELSALAWDGIGSGTLIEYTGPECSTRPACVHGHASWCEGEDYFMAISTALWAAGLTADFNDMLVKNGERISWDEYCRRGNIVRGEDQ